MSNSTLGWVSEPDGRGTMTIIWSCTVTIALCCWSSLCVNAPARGEKHRWHLLDKFNLACIGILGPEFLFALALGQWQSAHCSVLDFHEAGYRTWTKRHAFFADMGGFLLEPLRWKAFPIDAKQLHYLVVHGYIEFPKIEIDDLAAVDTFGRYVKSAELHISGITYSNTARQ